MADDGRINRERTDHGHYAEEYPSERVLGVFNDRTDPDEPLTANEVAEALECDRKTAYNKLQSLADSGDLGTKKVGARGRVYWKPGVDTDGA